MDTLKKIEKSAFDKRKKKPGLKFNPRLERTGVRTSYWALIAGMTKLTRITRMTGFSGMTKMTLIPGMTGLSGLPGDDRDDRNDWYTWDDWDQLGNKWQGGLE